MKHFGLSLLAALTMAALVTAFNNHRRIGESRLTLSEWSARRRGLTDAIERASQQLADLEKDRVRRERADNRPSEGKAGPPAATKRLSSEMTLALIKAATESYERQKDPLIQHRWLATMREKNEINYQSLLRRLGLNTELVREFHDNLARRDEQVADLTGVMQAQNLDFSDPAISQLYRQADTDYTAAQKALLGEQGFAQLQDYNRTLPVRELTANLAGMFAVTGDPLTPEQSERLVQALANGSAGYLKGQQALQGGLDLDWAEVDRLAAAVLAPAQLEIFQTTELPIGGEGRFWVQVNKTINEARNAEKQAHKLSGG